MRRFYDKQHTIADKQIHTQIDREIKTIQVLLIEWKEQISAHTHTEIDTHNSL